MAGGICDLATRMPSSHQQTISHAISAESWPQGRIDLAAGFILLFSLLARVWAASGTFLNPDEALHFRLANQTSWALAYRQSLTASHPPLLTFILYFWRGLGTSELWLRMPSILAGVVFCWMFYKWLRNAAGDLAGLIGLIFVSFLPPVVLLSAEIRQYALLLAFLAAALYFSGRFFREELIGQNDCIFPVPLPGDVVALLRLLVRRGPRHLCVIAILHRAIFHDTEDDLGHRTNRRTRSRDLSLQEPHFQTRRGGIENRAARLDERLFSATLLFRCGT